MAIYNFLPFTAIEMHFPEAIDLIVYASLLPISTEHFCQHLVGPPPFDEMPAMEGGLIFAMNSWTEQNAPRRMTLSVL